MHLHAQPLPAPLVPKIKIFTFKTKICTFESENKWLFRNSDLDIISWSSMNLFLRGGKKRNGPSCPSLGTAIWELYSTSVEEAVVWTRKGYCRHFTSRPRKLLTLPLPHRKPNEYYESNSVILIPGMQKLSHEPNPGHGRFFCLFGFCFLIAAVFLKLSNSAFM